MKTADLYVRVSTDEQADKRLLQRGQEELLRRYCDINKLNIGRIIYEDHSAKTFNRPEWQKYLIDLRKRKRQVALPVQFSNRFLTDLQRLANLAA